MKRQTLRKIITTSIACVMMMVTLTACGGKDDSSSEDKEVKDLSNSSTQEKDTETKKETESSIEEVTLLNVKYNPEDGTITGTVKNNTDERFDSILLKGTIDYHKVDSYGKEAEEATTVPLNGDTSTLGYAEIPLYFYSEEQVRQLSEGRQMIVIDIPSRGEKNFTFFLKEFDEETPSLSNPQLQLEKTTIRDKDEGGLLPQYYALESEATAVFKPAASGNGGTITVTNNSNYQWDVVEVQVTYTGSSLHKGETVVTAEKATYVDIGATATIELNEVVYSGVTDIKLGNVKFQPNMQE